MQTTVTQQGLIAAVDSITRTARLEVLTPGRRAPCVVTVRPAEDGDGWLVTDPTDPEPTWRATVDAALGEAVARASCILEDRLLDALGQLRPPGHGSAARAPSDVC